MLKFEKTSDCDIQVALPGTTYIAEATSNWDKETGDYVCQVRIKRQDIDEFMILDGCTKVISCEPREIKYKLAEHITDLYANKVFKEAMQSYEYKDRCFNRGLNIIESEV